MREFNFKKRGFARVQGLIVTSALTLLHGCFDSTQIVDTQTSPVVVDPGKTVCDPFTNNPGHIGASLSNGIVGSLSFLPESSQADYWQSLPYYKTNGTPVDVTMFLSELNVPTRKFDLGFTTQTGTLITNEKGTKLYEYFSIHFETQLKLLSGDTEGPYQLALLSDDGAVIQIDPSFGATPQTPLVNLVPNDGTHPSKFLNATVPVMLQRGVPLPLSVDYYQGPRHHIALMLLWRPWPRGAGAPPSNDPQSGQQGNERFFNYNNVPSTPQQAYNDMLARGWKVVPEANLELPSRYTSNPCIGTAPPAPPVNPPSQDTTGGLDLFASKQYSPSSIWMNGTYKVFYPLELTIPASLSVTSGNAGNHYATIQIDQMTCLYQGGSSQAHPNGTTQVNLGLKYNFRFCVDAVGAPLDIVAAGTPHNSVGATSKIIARDQVILRIDNGDSYKNPTLVQAVLPSLVDVTKPAISLGLQSPLFTTQNALSLPISVVDSSSVVTTVRKNGTTLVSENSPSFTFTATLNQGQNVFEISSVDSFGNTSEVKTFSATLDSAPPVLTLTSPTQNATVSTLAISFAGSANESLATLLLNDQPLTLATDKKSFSGTVAASGEGPFALRFQATDLAGNSTTLERNVNIVLRLLQPSLVSVTPAPGDPTKVLVQGAPGAAHPASKLTLSFGFFSKVETTPSSDGSFLIESAFFTTASLKAEYVSQNREETISLNHQSTVTVLSGVVKDTDDRALPGVQVTVLGRSDISPAVTDSSGVFAFSQPVNGDQTLYFDGSHVVDPCQNCASRKFTTTSLKVSVGLNQTNALERTVYLPPTMMDGTAVSVTPAQGGTVSSPHAPGVALQIPANAMPNSNNGPVEISMSLVDSAKTTAEIPEFAVPEKVVNLEPSGLVFSKRVDLTLPNENELPAGANLLIFSFDSATGKWSPDGIAQVTPDGQSVKTKPGLGISHFSQVYAIPPGAQVTQLGAQDKPGANTFDGGLSASVQMPSYRALGTDIAPTLLYNSNWAAPGVTVTNLLSLPSVQASATVVEGRTILEKIIFFFDPSPVVTTFYQIVPEEMTANFQTADIIGEKLTFTGIPRESAVSFHFDLASLESGLYPYSSHWDIKLKHIRTATIQKRRKKYALFGPIENSGVEIIDKSFYQFLTNDFAGQLFVQNKINSEVGRGWRIQGPARIVNPNDSRVMIEESDGNVSSYTLENSISTVADAKDKDYTFANLASIQWPNAYVQKRSLDGGRFAIGKLDLENVQAASSLTATMPSLNGRIRHNWTHVEPCGFLGQSRCKTASRTETNYSAPRLISKFVKLPSGAHYSLSTKFHTLHLGQGDGVQSGLYAGGSTVPPTSNGGEENPASAVNFINSVYCNGVLGVNCSFSGRISGQGPSSGEYPLSGTAVSGTATQVNELLFNSPEGFAVHPTLPVLAIADTGNHRVIEINLSNGNVQTVAGNLQTVPKTDAVPATQSTVVRPVAVTYDSAGQMFVLTDEGYIRFVDLTGTIRTIGGMPAGVAGSQLVNQGPAATFALKNPKSLVLDEQAALLFVADTGNQRVVAFDLSGQDSDAYEVAGNRNKGNGVDGPSALNVSLDTPTGLALDSDRNLLIVDSGNDKIRRVVFNRSVVAPLSYAPASSDLSKLTRNVATGEYIRIFRDGSFQKFNPAGYETSISNRLGRTLSYSYDVDNRLRFQTDPAGGQIEYSYAGGKLSTITDPAGRVTTLNYDGDLLAAINMPEGQTRRFEYEPNGNGRIATEVNENGFETKYVYNSVGRLAKVIRPDQREVVINDFASGTVANGYTGGNTGQIKPKKQSDSANDITDPRNIKVSMKPDNSGYISEMKDPGGIVTKVERNLRGQATAVFKDFKDNGTEEDDSDDTYQTKVTLTYDEITGDLLTQTDSATGNVSSKTYNSFGQVFTETSSTGITTTHIYDSVTGLETETRDSVNGVLGKIEYNNNPFKLPSKRTNALLKSTEFFYDGFGNLAEQRTPVQGSVVAIQSFVRDAAGNVKQSTDPKGAITKYEYDGWNRVTAVITPEGERTEYSYSKTGKLLEVLDAKENTISYVYNELDQLVQRTDQLGQIYTYKYDESGNLNEEHDPNGNVKKFVYNSRNQLERKELPDDLIEISYDLQGNIKTHTSQEYGIQIDLDPLSRRINSIHTYGRGTQSNHPSVLVSFDYDNFDRVKKMTSPFGVTEYGYDTYSRLTSVLNPRNEFFQFKFDILGREYERNRPGSKSVNSFDDGSFVTGITHSKLVGTNLATFTYARDLNGLRTSINRSGISQLTLGYDKNQQLKSVLSSNISAVPEESYGYDEVYNRKTDQGGSYTYDSRSQRLTEDYRNFYFYDNNGNLVSKQAKGLTGEVTLFSYSSENQLKTVSVYKPGAPQANLFIVGSSVPSKEISYSYDPFGRRVEKQVIDHENSQGSFTRRYAYNGEELITEYDENNTPLAHYTHRLNQSDQAMDDVLSVSVTSEGSAKGLAQNEGSYHFLKDGIGSITEVADSNGNLVQRIVYGAFGLILGIRDANANELSTAPLKTHYAFTGREYDEETGNYYYRARYYDPKLGRFLQKDPMPGVVQSPATLVNSYNYGLNNAANLTDPSGKFPWLLAIAYVAISSVTLAAITTTVSYLLDKDPNKKWDFDYFIRAATFNFILGLVTLGAGVWLGGANDISFNGLSVSLKGIKNFTGLSLGPVNLQGSTWAGGLQKTGAELAQMALHESVWHPLQYALIPWGKSGKFPVPWGYAGIGAWSFIGAAGLELPFYTLIEGDWFGMGSPR